MSHWSPANSRTAPLSSTDRPPLREAVVVDLDGRTLTTEKQFDELAEANLNAPYFLTRLPPLPADES
ncbi:hypothetical protein DP939_30945 [Spongiactinospora rosea]|uniref:Uncharacterized protein n=1 Tax=Spongiactinospora rosea TaxID=2248750 RepID=A0A366LST3_9ACTN|nr:hypothetical protein DP939_30945 [Spongiactinospora rosea]